MSKYQVDPKTWTTQELINAKCVINRELYKRKLGKQFGFKEATPGTLKLTNIPHGYDTLKVYDIVRGYGRIKQLEWVKDKDKEELNSIIVVFWCLQDTQKLLENGFYDLQEHFIFAEKVVIE